MTHLAVSECFGPTFQGEGPSTGRRAIFLRLAGCNLKCGINGGWKCDTPYTWDWRGEIGPKQNTYEQVQLMEVGDVIDLIATKADEGTRLLVITGGEPLLQARNLGELLDLTVQAGWDVEFETNGTIPAPWLWHSGLAYNVSPKLESSGNPLEKRLNVPALKSFVGTQRARFKFVIANEQDYDEVMEVCRIVGIPPKMVWLMPEGIDFERLIVQGEKVADAATALGYNFTQRLHILTWGNERGR